MMPGMAVVPIVALAPVLNSMYGADSEYGRRMIAAIASFVPVFVNTLHPNIFGRRFTWQAGRGVVVQDGHYALMDTDEYRESPITAVRAPSTNPSAPQYALRGAASSRWMNARADCFGARAL